MKTEKIVELITARGHPQILAAHPTTLMITKEKEVGPRGDCVVAVAADKGAADLSVALKRAVGTGGVIKIKLEVGDMVETIEGRGHPRLPLSHPADIVVRKGSFTCERTLAIGANKAAANLPRSLVRRLRDPRAKLKITVESEAAES